MRCRQAGIINDEVVRKVRIPSSSFKSSLDELDNLNGRLLDAVPRQEEVRL